MFMRLLRHFDGARLADDHHLDVPRVLHLGLDALGDVLRELVGVEVGDDVGLGHHAELAPGLDRVAQLHTLVGHRDLLELREALDVGLEHVAPGARPRRRDAVGRLDQHRLDRLGLDVLVPQRAALMTAGDSLYLVSTCSDSSGWLPSCSCVSALPMSWSSPMRLASLTSTLISAAIIPASQATSFECWRQFWP